MDKKAAIHTMNELGTTSTPFVFIVDYKMENCHIFQLNELFDEQIKISTPKFSNYKNKIQLNKSVIFKKNPISYNDYKIAFDVVKRNIEIGNSYLTNLTFQTPIETNLNLNEIFEWSKAPYKLQFKDEFVVFSPEIFIQIIDDKIYAFPMKGTIDASIPNADRIIIEDTKEAAEHATITDLIRNDLSIIASNVKVDHYRYIDRLKTNQGELLQVSSKISGTLPKNYNNRIGDLLFGLLPAGSISGAPKQKTIDIIEHAENYRRGYYTGIFGYFDGKTLDSAVMIRFIEKSGDKFIFKSGGGITSNSICSDEYNELMNKVYLTF